MTRLLTDKGVTAPPLGLYVHVPFCVSICPYCDFVVYAGASARGERSRIGRFLAAVRSEIVLRARRLDEAFGEVGTAARPLLRSLYLGGGTPSILPPEEVASLIGLVRAVHGLEPDAEVTIEANPGATERGDAVALAQAGVTRYSIGAQSLDAALLRRLGRRHTPDDVAAAVAEARAAGIPSISADLLYDVPGQTLGRFLDDVESLMELDVDHVSLYALTLDDPGVDGLTDVLGDHLEPSGGARRWRTMAVAEQDPDRAAAQYHAAAALLAGAGYRGYEISNWARPGHASRHNLAYWRREPVEAVGPGAHAFDGATRRWNAAPLDAYLAALAPPDGSPPALPPGGEEPLDPTAARAEMLILGLRLDTGIPFAAALETPLGDDLAPALAAGLLELTEVDGAEHVRLTTSGRLLSNELLARLV